MFYGKEDKRRLAGWESALEVLCLRSSPARPGPEELPPGFVCLILGPRGVKNTTSFTHGTGQIVRKLPPERAGSPQEWR